jgi:hypothetical protein
VVGCTAATCRRICSPIGRQRQWMRCLDLLISPLTTLVSRRHAQSCWLGNIAKLYSSKLLVPRPSRQGWLAECACVCASSQISCHDGKDSSITDHVKVPAPLENCSRPSASATHGLHRFIADRLVHGEPRRRIMHPRVHAMSISASSLITVQFRALTVSKNYWCNVSSKQGSSTCLARGCLDFCFHQWLQKLDDGEIITRPS